MVRESCAKLMLVNFLSLCDTHELAEGVPLIPRSHVPNKLTKKVLRLLPAADAKMKVLLLF